MALEDKVKGNFYLELHQLINDSYTGKLPRDADLGKMISDLQYKHMSRAEKIFRAVESIPVEAYIAGGVALYYLTR